MSAEKVCPRTETCPKCGESYTPGMTVHCALMDKCYYTAPNVRTDDDALDKWSDAAIASQGKEP